MEDKKSVNMVESLEVIDFTEIEEMEDVINGASFGIGGCCIDVGL